MAAPIRGQRRSRRVAMTPDERDAFLAEQKVCRVATISVGGGPHVQPLWYVWDGEFLWLYSIVRSQRWVDLERDPRIAVVVDAGEDAYTELRGVELAGTVEVVGEVPRRDEPNPELEAVEKAFHERYFPSRESVPNDGRHAWLRMRVEREYTWDFRKAR